MTEPFAYTSRAVRVVFGENALSRLPQELDRLAAGRVYLVGTPGREAQLEQLARSLGTRVAGSFTGARVHVPGEVTDRAVSGLDRAGATTVLALGGGSAIGVAKALARIRELKIAAVPTTYSGSEMTDVWGTTSAGEKRTGRDARVAPGLVLYDPLLTLSLPPHESATSGMNAIAHAVEALYAPDRNPIATLFAHESIRLLSSALPAIVREPGDADARSRALLGAHFAGQALQLTTMGLHHRICHVLGGLGLPHATTHAILLPHVVAFKAPNTPEAMHIVAAALGSAGAVTGLVALEKGLGITERLRDIGLAENQIAPTSQAVAASFGDHGGQLEDAVRQVLQAAY